MRKLLIAAAFAVSSPAAFGAITNFELPIFNGAAGAVYKSADHPGTVYVMEAFQNFCPSCNENAENVDALATDYASNGKVQVLDLSLDTNTREIRNWIANHHPNHPVVQDLGKKIWAEINEQYIPTTVVVDCSGAIVYKSVGTWEGTSELKAAVDDAVAACN
jgi:hypothetical protein